MDKKIESYIHQIVKELDCNDTEKQEIADEIQDHLTMLKIEYIENGFTEQEASSKALESFGDKKKIYNGYKEVISPYYKFLKITNWSLFFIYSTVILWNLLFQRLYFSVINYPHNHYFFSRNGIVDELVQNMNVIPMKNTLNYIINHDRFNMDIIIHNTVGNILIFIPLGIFLPLLFKRYFTLSKVIVLSIVISFSIEALQLIIQIGQFDIDDIILNSIGSVLGFLGIRIIMKMLGNAKNKLLSYRLR